jgi:hypothetical protein
VIKKKTNQSRCGKLSVITDVYCNCEQQLTRINGKTRFTIKKKAFSLECYVRNGVKQENHLALENFKSDIRT